MFTNINPYICSNIREFEEDRKHLRDVTFVRIRQELDNLNVNFSPLEIDWTENDNYVRSGYLLRLLLYNVKKSMPFFICLLGQQYGPYLEEKSELELLKRVAQADPSDAKLPTLRSLSWLAKNVLVASQTGFHTIVNPATFQFSLLEYQINTALYHAHDPSYLRFYFRQSEFLDDKFMHLSIEERKRAISAYEAENDYCDFKIKDLKMQIAKKGFFVKYYKSLDELDKLVYEDFTDIIKKYIEISASFNKPKSLWTLENFVFTRLQTYLITPSLVELVRLVDLFCKRNDNTLLLMDSSTFDTKSSSQIRPLNRNKSNLSVQFRLDSSLNKSANQDYYTNYTHRSNEIDESFGDYLSHIDKFIQDEQSEKLNNDDDKNEDFMEILKLRHTNAPSSVLSTPSFSNLAKFSSAKKRRAYNPVKLCLVLGPRGQGKTAFMSLLYHNYQINQCLDPDQLTLDAKKKQGVFDELDEEEEQEAAEEEEEEEEEEGNFKPRAQSSAKPLNQKQPLYLFYFLKSNDHFESIIVDMIIKLRLKFTMIGLYFFFIFKNSFP